MNADFLAHIDDDQVRHIFRTSKGVMPMLVERAESLREVGKILQEVSALHFSHIFDCISLLHNVVSKYNGQNLLIR